jgi:hypothetical protein
MRQAVDPTTLKKGDTIYIETTENAAWSNIPFEIRKCQFNVSTTTSDNDTYVEMVAILKGTNGTEIKRRDKTEQLGYPSKCYSSQTSFFMQVFICRELIIQNGILFLSNSKNFEQPPDQDTTVADLGNSRKHCTRNSKVI